MDNRPMMREAGIRRERHMRIAPRGDSMRTTITRGGRAARCLLTALAAAVTLTLLPAASQSAELLRVGKAGREAFSFVPVDIGAKKGLFQKHGVEVEISAFGGSARIHQAMTAGAIDIALAAGTDLPFIVKGEPSTAVAALANPPLLLSLVVRPDDTIKTVADLKGRKAAVSTVGSLTSWLTTELSRQQGWGVDGIGLVAVGETSARIAALRTHAVDAIVVDMGTAFDLEKRNEGRILYRLAQVAPDFHTNVIFATNKLIQDRPEALRGFLAGWFETIAWMKANRAETIALSKDVMGVDDAIAARTYDELFPMFSTDGRFSPTALARLSKSFVDMGMLPKEPDLSKLYTEAFLPGRK
jgi:NitT/TauT family transport system substrate-binding protein